jgi:hypothetical protein
MTFRERVGFAAIVGFMATLAAVLFYSVVVLGTPGPGYMPGPFDSTPEACCPPDGR